MLTKSQRPGAIQDSRTTETLPSHPFKTRHAPPPGSPPHSGPFLSREEARAAAPVTRQACLRPVGMNSPTGVLTDLPHQVSSVFSPIFSKRNCKLCSVALHSQAHSTWQKSPESPGSTHKNGNGPCVRRDLLGLEQPSVWRVPHSIAERG